MHVNEAFTHVVQDRIQGSSSPMRLVDEIHTMPRTDIIFILARLTCF